MVEILLALDFRQRRMVVVIYASVGTAYTPLGDSVKNSAIPWPSCPRPWPPETRWCWPHGSPQVATGPPQCPAVATGSATTPSSPWTTAQDIIFIIIALWLRASTLLLTFSLPWCHLKTANKSVKFEVLKQFLSLFRISTWKDSFHHNAQYWKWFVVGPENILLFGGVSVHFSAQKFYKPGQWRG